MILVRNCMAAKDIGPQFVSYAQIINPSSK